MSLEKKLAATAEQWLAQATVSPAQAAALEQSIRRRARRRAWRTAGRAAGWVAAAAAALVLAVAAVPGVRAWAGRNLPMVGRYIARRAQLEEGWAWARRHGMFQETLAEAYDAGYTVRVHQVLADSTQTTVIYTVEGQDPRDLREVDVTVDGQWAGRTGGGRGEVIDGVLVGSIELDPIPGETAEIRLTVRRIGEVRGRWQLAFAVDRTALSALARRVEIGHRIGLPNGVLTVEGLLLAPTQTVVRLQFAGQPEGPDLRDSALLLPGGAARSRGGGSRGHRQADGSWVQTYELQFQRLDPMPAAMTLQLAGRVQRPGETRVPLEPAGAGAAPDGRPVTVEALAAKGAEGRATLAFPVDDRNLWPLDIMGWQVLDDGGELHRTDPVLPRGASGAATPAAPGETRIQHDTVRWTLPAGRKAVALVNATYWTYEPNLAELAIAIPAE